jgi:hypothetical protein
MLEWMAWQRGSLTRSIELPSADLLFLQLAHGDALLNYLHRHKIECRDKITQRQVAKWNTNLAAAAAAAMDVR